MNEEEENIENVISSQRKAVKKNKKDKRKEKEAEQTNEEAEEYAENVISSERKAEKKSKRDKRKTEIEAEQASEEAEEYTEDVISCERKAEKKRKRDKRKKEKEAEEEEYTENVFSSERKSEKKRKRDKRKKENEAEEEEYTENVFSSERKSEKKRKRDKRKKEKEAEQATEEAEEEEYAENVTSCERKAEKKRKRDKRKKEKEAEQASKETEEEEYVENVISSERKTEKKRMRDKRKKKEAEQASEEAEEYTEDVISSEGKAEKKRKRDKRKTEKEAEQASEEDHKDAASADEETKKSKKRKEKCTDDAVVLDQKEKENELEPQYETEMIVKKKSKKRHRSEDDDSVQSINEESKKKRKKQHEASQEDDTHEEEEKCCGEFIFNVNDTYGEEEEALDEKLNSLGMDVNEINHIFQESDEDDGLVDSESESESEGKEEAEKENKPWKLSAAFLYKKIHQNDYSYDISESEITDMCNLGIVIDWVLPPAHVIRAGLPWREEDYKYVRRLGVKMRLGSWCVTEMNKIKKNWEEFKKLYKITNPLAFLNLKHSKMRPKQRIKFAQFLARGIDNRTIIAVYAQARRMMDPYNYQSPYTKEEDELLLQLVEKYRQTRNCFIRVSRDMHRDEHSINAHYKQISKAFKSGKWSVLESKRLIANLVLLTGEKNIRNLHHNIPWVEIENMMGKRNSSSCRGHWLFVLSKYIFRERNRTCWTVADNINLIKTLYDGEYQTELDVPWSDVNKLFNCDNCFQLRAKWNAIVHIVPGYYMKTLNETVAYLHKYILPIWEARKIKNDKKLKEEKLQRSMEQQHKDSDDQISEAVSSQTNHFQFENEPCC